MIAGVYNLGYVSLAPGPEVDRLLDWWADRLRRDCRVDPMWGYFVDQRWFDLAPGLRHRPRDRARPRVQRRLLEPPRPHAGARRRALPRRRPAARVLPLQRLRSRAPAGAQPPPGPHRRRRRPGARAAPGRVRRTRSIGRRHASEPELALQLRRARRRHAARRHAAARCTTTSPTSATASARRRSRSRARRRSCRGWTQQAPASPPGHQPRAGARIRGSRRPARCASRISTGPGRAGLLRWAESTVGARSRCSDPMVDLTARAPRQRHRRGGGAAHAPAARRIPPRPARHAAEPTAPLGGQRRRLLPLRARDRRGRAAGGRARSTPRRSRCCRSTARRSRSAGRATPTRPRRPRTRRSRQPDLHERRRAARSSPRRPARSSSPGATRSACGSGRSSRFPERWQRLVLAARGGVGADRARRAALAPVAHGARRAPIRIPVQLPPLAPRSRAELGLPEDKFVFLFSFDYLSVFERKNPLAVIDAFAPRVRARRGRRAWSSSASTPERDPDAPRAAARGRRAHPDVEVIDRYLRPPTTTA